MNADAVSFATPRSIGVLCFDGGGLRGLSSLLILKEIMAQVNSSHMRSSDLPSGILLKPCDVFDVIGGTSVGGIFAVLLGRLKMTVDEAIDSYRSNFMFERTGEPKQPRMERASRIFSKLKPSSKPRAAETAAGPATAPLFDQEAFRKRLTRVVLSAQKLPRTRGNQIIPGSPMTCQTVITASRSLPAVLADNNNKKEMQPHIFRDFGEGITSDAEKLVIACQATCAVPGLLAPVHRSSAVEGIEELAAVDSSRMNPITEILDEARHLFPGAKVALVVSIGAGRPSSSPVEGDDKQWIPALHAMDEGYFAAEAKAELMAAEQEMLSWTNYFRFSIPDTAAEVGIDEMAAYSKVKQLSGEFCVANLDQIKNLARLVFECRPSDSRYSTVFHDYGYELVKAVAWSELLTIQRLLPRSRELYHEGSTLRRKPVMLLEEALDTEELFKKAYGANAKALSRAVEVTEWLRVYLQKHPLYQSSWNIPADPSRHSQTRRPWNSFKPTLKELIMALVPCHKSTVEQAQYVLDNFFDAVFTTPVRAEWIWNLAEKTDQQVRDGSWLKTVRPESVRVSSEVLHLLRSRLSTRFPDGPWSLTGGIVSAPRNDDKSRQHMSTQTVPAVPERNDSMTDAAYEQVAREYTRDPTSLAQINDIVPGLERLDPFKRRGQKPPSNEYRYWPLPDGNFSRVIVLSPCVFADDEELRCDIEFLDLDREFYTYDAVSYVWGEPRFDETLYCGPNVQELPITPTLASTLRSFRSRTTPRRLWVDAVCINQRDNSEKSRQVAAMALIYKCARATLIYLGDPAPGQEHYMYFMLKLASLVGSFTDAGIDTARNNRLIKEAMMEVFGAEKASLVEELTKLPWFGRRWIIQEAALCKVAVAFFGRSTHKIVVVLLAMAALANSSYVTPRVARGAFDSLSVIESVRTHQSGLLAHGRTYGILDVLIHSHCSETSEPRDRLFALLSLAPDVNSAIPGSVDGPGISLWPDYSKFLGETYTDFATQCLCSSPTLDVLHCAGAFQHTTPDMHTNPYFMIDGPMGLPSFVPDWTAPRRYIPFAGEPRFTAGFGAENATSRRRLDARPLIIPGLTLDTVKITSVPFPSRLLPEWVLDIVHACYRVYESLPSNKDRTIPLEALVRILTADHALLVSNRPLTRATPESEEQQQQDDGRAERIRNALFLGFRQLYLDYKSAGRRVNFLKSSDGGRDNNLQLQSARLICRTMEGRSFFISEKGSMGIAPGNVQVGDIVAILFGVRTPFVLRPDPVDGRHGYKIVGDCYVDGFMGGEALRAPGLESRDFRIW